MRYLPKTGFKGWLQYAAAFVLVVAAAYPGVYVWNQIRRLGSIYCGYVGCHGSQMRLMAAVTWIVPGIAWFVYALVCESRIVSAVTDARQQKMHTPDAPAEIVDKPLMLWLWNNNFHLVFPRFAKLLAIPIVLGLIIYIISALLIRSAAI